MKAPIEPSSTEPARLVGEHLHGGNRVILVTIDEKNGFACGSPSRSKHSANLMACMIDTVAMYSTYGHSVKRLTTDDERTRVALKMPLGAKGIAAGPTPAGLYEKTAERFMQTIKSHKRAICAQLPYELPAVLECEAFIC